MARERNDEPVMFPEDWVYRPFFSVPDYMFGQVPDHAWDAWNALEHIDERARPYMQDYNVIKDHMPEIRSYLHPCESASLYLEQFKPILGLSLCIHVRRGDNVYDPGIPNKNDYHLCPDLSYYERGRAQFPEMPTVVFGDDAPWNIANIPAQGYGAGLGYPKENDPAYGVHEPMDWVDLFLMMQSTHFVVSGSTFGIWAALLSGSNDVVRPAKVYGPLLGYIDSELLFPTEWKVIPHVA
jgi:hypothetical protein